MCNKNVLKLSKNVIKEIRRKLLSVVSNLIAFTITFYETYLTRFCSLKYINWKDRFKIPGVRRTRKRLTDLTFSPLTTIIFQKSSCCMNITNL